MSFILDALKKSESDRQRQGGPALFEVKVAPPRRVLPAWAVVIAVLFVANLAVVGWLLLRHGTPAAEAAPAARVPPRTQAEPAPAPPATVPPTAVAMNAPVALNAGAAAAPAVSPAVRSVATLPAAAPAGAAPSEPPPSADDLAPAAEPPPSGSVGKVKRATEAGVPLYQQLAAAPGTRLPQLRLDLHAYAEHAQDRWVLINMHKLREGDSLEGVRVEHITPDGAVLSYQGSQFLLTRE
ncbi:MAG TPA: general secretion pathway protein GspB [Steroidobacteraceae bacterium]|nr:general secretion pathway protein GspB [Steroidobacteraceae bacterium]